MISLFVIEHIAGGNLFYGLFQECTLRKNEMDVIVGFPLIVMQGCDTIRSVSLSEMVCKYLQQFVWRILRKRFRQGYDQFPCLNTFPLRTTFFKFCMITFCKVTPERTFCGFIYCIQIFLLLGAWNIINSSPDIVELRHLNKWISWHVLPPFCICQVRSYKKWGWDTFLYEVSRLHR